MSKRVLIIDSLNLFLRSYIVNPTMSKDGNPIGGTIGFIASLQKLMREIKPDVIIACWDGRDGSRKRKQANKNYKAGRSPVRLNRNFKMLNEEQEQENKIWQMHRIFEYLNNFPIIQLVADEVEADDIISYITRYSCFKEEEKVIVSSDKDFYQLLDENTVLHRPIQKQYLNKFNILEEHGIHPTNFALARAMVGDKSDNLVGVPGVGLKTVAKRFAFFAEDRDVSIPELIEFCSNQESKVKAFQSVIDNEELIKDNYSLMQLYSPSLSIQTKQRIDWSIDEFDFEFNKTETDVMMITDGIADNHWGDLFQGFKRMCWKKK